ncbi:hypothetical protein FAGKG844_60044 [Frankia sp. AgKG'84/4]
MPAQTAAGPASHPPSLRHVHARESTAGAAHPVAPIAADCQGDPGTSTAVEPDPRPPRASWPAPSRPVDSRLVAADPPSAAGPGAPAEPSRDQAGSAVAAARARQARSSAATRVAQASRAGPVGVPPAGAVPDSGREGGGTLGPSAGRAHGLCS